MKLFFLKEVQFYNHAHFNSILIISGNFYYCSHQLHNTALQSITTMAMPQLRLFSHQLLTTNSWIQSWV
jgi:hypothetical protein